MKTRGKEIAEKGFALVDKALAGKDYAVGKFSIADAAIFYVEFWVEARRHDAAGELRGASGAHDGPPRRATRAATGRPGLSS